MYANTFKKRRVFPDELLDTFVKPSGCRCYELPTINSRAFS